MRASVRPLEIVVLEPSAELGRGIAYGTTDPAHRINVPSERMDVGKGEPGAATAWLSAHGFLSDAGSGDVSGSYVSRHAYGTYIGDLLARTVAATGGRTRLQHLRQRATAVRPAGGGWQVECENGERLEADRVALCFGHAVPALPCPLGPGVAEEARFVADPWAPAALAGIAADDGVLIVGTGLTMADVVASLAARGHRGPLTAVSRRALLPKPHGIFLNTLQIVAGDPPRTALGLLRLLRRRIRSVDPALGWHPVVDSLRTVLPDLWNGLSAREQKRVVRRLLPFWEIHRFRIAPQVDAALARARERGQLTIEQAALVGLDRDRDGGLSARLRRRTGTIDARRFDAVVLCTGPERDVSANPLVAALLSSGTARLDTVGLGLCVDRASRVLDAAGTPAPGLYALGPMTRGSFGEMTGAPDIAHHIERVVARILDDA